MAHLTLAPERLVRGPAGSHRRAWRGTQRSPSLRAQLPSPRGRAPNPSAPLRKSTADRAHRPDHREAFNAPLNAVITRGAAVSPIRNVMPHAPDLIATARGCLDRFPCRRRDSSDDSAHASGSITPGEDRKHLRCLASLAPPREQLLRRQTVPAGVTPLTVAPGSRLSATILATSSADQSSRRPAPVNASSRRLA